MASKVGVEMRANRTGQRKTRSVRAAASSIVLGVSLLLGGCSTVVSGTLTLSDFSNIFGLVSSLATGKGLEEHVLSIMTGKDCKILDGVLRADRKICEEKGSIGTDKDFKGVFVMVFGEDREQTPARMYAQDVDRGRLDELRPAPAAAPSMNRPVRRAQRSGGASAEPTSSPVGPVLAAAAAVTQTQAMVRTTNRAPVRSPAKIRAADTSPAAQPSDPAQTGEIPETLRAEPPSLSRTLRQTGRGPEPVIVASVGETGTDTLDRLETLWWTGDDASSDLAAASGQRAAPSPSAPSPIAVDYVDGGIAVEMVFAPRPQSRADQSH